MRTHAVFLRLDGRLCVIVGGDTVATDKVEHCLAARARVTVVAPALTPTLERRRVAGDIRYIGRPYRDGDLRGAFLAYASECHASVVDALRAEAERERVLLNVVDVPGACAFYAPAIVARGDLQIAIGTGGSSPGLASALRRDLETRIGPEYEPYVAILGAVRQSLPGGVRATVMARLLNSELLSLVRRGERAAIDALLQGMAGDGCTLGELGLSLGGEG